MTVMRPLLCALALAALGGGAAAMNASAPGDRRMTAAEAEAFLDGRTLVFRQEDAEGGELDAAYGAEQYMEGREAIWQYPDGSCTRGVWRVNGDALCFAYADDPSLVLCWGFWEDADGVYARLRDSPQDDRLRVVAETGGPLQCEFEGPGV